MKSYLIFLATLMSQTIAFAQLDPSSGLLLDSNPKSSNRENGLDSGRYKVRQRSESNLGERKKSVQAKPNYEQANEKADPDDESETSQKSREEQLATISKKPRQIQTHKPSLKSRKRLGHCLKQMDLSLLTPK